MKRDDFIWGMVLIAIGLIFLASNLGRMPEVHVGQMWPWILVVVGVAQLFTKDKDGLLGGLTLILTGGIFLAHNYWIVRLNDSWPLFIVVAGLSVMFGSRYRKVEGRKP